VEATLRQPGIPQKRQVDAGHLHERGGGIRLAAHHDEGPGVVVGAIAMLHARDAELSVLPDSQMIGHPLQMVEAGFREGADETAAGRTERPDGDVAQCTKAGPGVN